MSDYTLTNEGDAVYLKCGNCPVAVYVWLLGWTEYVSLSELIKRHDSLYHG